MRTHIDRFGECLDYTRDFLFRFSMLSCMHVHMLSDVRDICGCCMQALSLSATICHSMSCLISTSTHTEHEHIIPSTLLQLNTNNYMCNANTVTMACIVALSQRTEQEPGHRRDMEIIQDMQHMQTCQQHGRGTPDTARHDTTHDMTRHDTIHDIR